MKTEAVTGEARSEAGNLDCIHCGLCLAVCPTYLQLGNEADSPRGRIYLIDALREGRVEPSSENFHKHVLLCLECRACETACPSGVRFSVMMNDARSAILERRRFSAVERVVRRVVFDRAMSSRPILRFGFAALRLYQRSGLQRLVRGSGILKLLPAALGTMESLLPVIPKRASYALPARVTGNGRLSVALFEGCIMPELFGPAHEATIRVLEKNGVVTCLPRSQTCCGALHIHEGEMAKGLDLARKNIDAFEADGADFIVTNAAGCGAMLKEYGQLLKDDPLYAERASAFSHRVKDISEFLDMLDISGDMGRLDLKVTYDDPCHLLHAQGVRAAPRNLLRRIPGIEFVEMRDSDRCCGSAGIYNITQPGLAGRILADKISNIERTGASVVATGNPGCLLQIQAGLRARKLPVRVVHPVELLDEAYRRGSDAGPTC
jgi:glycolate dehydrogenase iron-sulfur subunit